MAHKQPIGLAEMKALEFELLSFLAGLCEEHQLRYYLGYGTLLGAVRHGGFIPWDDDIDVLMPRRDYLRLIEIMEQKDFENIKILSLQNEADYIYPFAKLIDARTVLYEGFNQLDNVPLGVYIDIFPLEGMTDNRFAACLFFARLKLLRRILALSLQKFPVSGRNRFMRMLKLPLVLLLKLPGHQRIVGRIDRLAGKRDFDRSDFVGCAVWSAHTSERMPRSCFAGERQLAFEGSLFPVPADYDRYLTQIYGNYMQFPPEAERVSKHRMEAFWK